MTFYSPSDLYLSLAFWEKLLALDQSRGCREKKNALCTGANAAHLNLLCLLNETEPYIWYKTRTLEISHKKKYYFVIGKCTALSGELILLWQH